MVCAPWRRSWFSPRRAIAAILLLTGLIAFGQGVFIFAKASLAQILLERAFEQTLSTGKPVKPWSWADTWPVARVRVARLHAEAIALNGASGQALAFGPGHLPNTPEPGEPGMAVYAAHRDTHFAFLRDVVVGDIIRVQRQDGQSFTFVVRETRVAPFDAAHLAPDRPGVWIALTTCWPFDAQFHGPERFIVEAELLG
ncbi:MAG: class GN sortase [Pseudomonadota bacterium]